MSFRTATHSAPPLPTGAVLPRLPRVLCLSPPLSLLHSPIPIFISPPSSSSSIYHYHRPRPSSPKSSVKSVKLPPSTRFPLSPRLLRLSSTVSLGILIAPFLFTRIDSHRTSFRRYQHGSIAPNPQNGIMADAGTQQRPLDSQQSANTQSTTQPTAAERPRLPNSLFPLGYKAGFSQWVSSPFPPLIAESPIEAPTNTLLLLQWAAISPATAEATVLAFLPFRSPLPALSPSDSHTAATASPPNADHGARECASNMVTLSGTNRIINEFTITRTSEPDPKNHLVMLHGYGAGLAFFYRNYDMLSRRPGWKVWSLDLLGYGRSSRPPFRIKSKEPDAKIIEAEDWFIDALEEWRKIRGIEKFTLLGHSFGGYLAVRYALKYKSRVNKLILVSPVGVPEDPYAVREALPDNPPSASAQEFTQNSAAAKSDPNLANSLKVDRQRMPSSSAPGSASASTTSLSTVADDRQSESAGPGPAGSSKPPRRPLPAWLTCLWEANISPFSIVRWSGPFGPRLVSGWTSRRFSQLPHAESIALHDYAYSLFRQRGSGEYALAYVLAPGAGARRPLLWRVQELIGIPSVWMYGDTDWMDVAGGFAAAEKIRGTALPQEKEKGWRGGEQWRGDWKGKGGEAKVQIVTKAGHHLYLDGWEEFNGLVLEEMADVEVRESNE